jgi:hypothetical protein
MTFSLSKYPINSINIDLKRSPKLSDRLQALREQTEQAIALISKQSATAAREQQQVNFLAGVAESRYNLLSLQEYKLTKKLIAYSL